MTTGATTQEATDKKLQAVRGLGMELSGSNKLRPYTHHHDATLAFFDAPPPP